MGAHCPSPTSDSITTTPLAVMQRLSLTCTAPLPFYHPLPPHCEGAMPAASAWPFCLGMSDADSAAVECRASCEVWCALHGSRHQRWAA